MSLSSKFGFLAKQSLRNVLASAGPTSTLHMFNITRCMATKLFVGGLSFRTDAQALRDAFTGFGELTEAIVITDRNTGRSRGFGFVNFTTDESAGEALSSMDGKELQGRHIRISYANPRFEGDGGVQGKSSEVFDSEPSSPQG